MYVSVTDLIKRNTKSKFSRKYPDTLFLLRVPVYTSFLCRASVSTILSCGSSKLLYFTSKVELDEAKLALSKDLVVERQHQNSEGCIKACSKAADKFSVLTKRHECSCEVYVEDQTMQYF